MQQLAQAGRIAQATLSLQAVVSDESKGQDTMPGMVTDDTATTLAHLGPQINYTWWSKPSAQAAVDFSVSIAASGEQLVPSYRVRSAVTWRF